LKLNSRLFFIAILLAIAGLVVLLTPAIAVTTQDDSQQTCKVDDSGVPICNCENYSGNMSEIRDSDIDNVFCDPRFCPDNASCCEKTFSTLFVPNIINKTVVPSVVNSLGVVNMTIRVNVTPGTTGIVQDFLPAGFRFIRGSFQVNGVNATPIVNDGAVQFNNLSSGEQVITFRAQAPSTPFPIQSFDTARAFFIRNGFVVSFSQTSVLVSVRGTFTNSISI